MHIQRIITYTQRLSFDTCTLNQQMDLPPMLMSYSPSDFAQRFMSAVYNALSHIIRFKCTQSTLFYRTRAVFIAKMMQPNWCIIYVAVLVYDIWSKRHLKGVESSTEWNCYRINLVGTKKATRALLGWSILVSAAIKNESLNFCTDEWNLICTIILWACQLFCCCYKRYKLICEENIYAWIFHAFDG